MDRCKCGCGTVVAEGKQYVRGHATRLKPEELEQYDKLFEQGLTFQEVGDKIGKTRQQAHNVYKKYFSEKYNNGKQRRAMIHGVENFNTIVDQANWHPLVLLLKEHFNSEIAPVVKNNRLSRIAFLLSGERCKLIYSERDHKYISFQVKNPDEYKWIFIISNPTKSVSWYDMMVFRFESSVIEAGKQYYIPINKRKEPYNGITPAIDFYQFLVKGV